MNVKTKCERENQADAKTRRGLQSQDLRLAQALESGAGFKFTPDSCVAMSATPYTKVDGIRRPEKSP